MWSFKKKSKSIKLIDFSVQNLSSGNVAAMLKHLEEEKSSGFKFIQVNYGKSEFGDTRCYLTIDHREPGVMQWFKDRNSAQVEEFCRKVSGRE